MLTTVACSYQRPSYWCQGRGRVVGRCGRQERGKAIWLHPCGPKTAAALAPTPTPRPWPWQGLGSNFWSILLNCPDPSRQCCIQAPPAHLQEKNAADPKGKKKKKLGTPYSGFSAHHRGLSFSCFWALKQKAALRFQRHLKLNTSKSQ